MTKAEAKAIVLNPDTPLIEVLIASIVNKAVHQGDERRLTFILDRLIGKVKDTVDINNYMSRIEKLTEAQVIDLGKDAIKFLGEKK